MTISIHVSTRAHRQRKILGEIRQANYTQTGDHANITGVYQEDKRVNDVYRYVINIKNGTSSIRPPYSKGLGKFKDQPTSKVTRRVVVLVIESPHKCEYDLQFNPMVPARGKTGVNIEEYICSLLKKYRCLGLDDGDYYFIICNPVQFQASLFSLHGIVLSSKNAGTTAIRDKVWQAIYSDGEKENFLNRLTVYKPTIVINACTSKLKSIITDELKEWGVGKDTAIFTANSHPCVWSTKTIITKCN